MSSNNYWSPYNSYFQSTESNCGQNNCNENNCGQNNTCWPNTCYQPCAPCPKICAPCPSVTYISTTGTITTVLPGNEIPAGTTILPNSTSVPANTVTVITGYQGTPSTYVGCISLNNGFFTIPVTGLYTLSITGCFAAPANAVTTGDYRRLFIYKVDSSTNLVTLLATDNRYPITGSPTCITLTTLGEFKCNDRLFFAATQLTSGATSSELSVGSRVVINRL